MVPRITLNKRNNKFTELNAFSNLEKSPEKKQEDLRKGK
jgi:hypothetical protein